MEEVSGLYSESIKAQVRAMPRFLIIFANDYEMLQRDEGLAIVGAETETEVRRKLKNAKGYYLYARVVEFRNGLRYRHEDYTLAGV